MAAQMSIREHLDELRVRVLRIAIAIGIITIFAMSFDFRPIDVAGVTLAYPFPDPVSNISTRLTLYMQETLLPPNVTLVQTAPGETQPVVLRLLTAVGRVVLRNKEIDRAERFLAQALELAQTLDDKAGAAKVLGNLAGAWHARGDYAR